MKTSYLNFNISCGEPVCASCPWDKNRTHNRYNITVSNKATKERMRFYFYTSIANPEIESANQLIDAFDCILDEALNGDMDFDEYCSEFGYDGYLSSRKVYNACQKSLAKVLRVVGDIEQVYDLHDEIIDLQNKRG